MTDRSSFRTLPDISTLIEPDIAFLPPHSSQEVMQLCTPRERTVEDQWGVSYFWGKNRIEYGKKEEKKLSLREEVEEGGGLTVLWQQREQCCRRSDPSTSGGSHSTENFKCSKACEYEERQKQIRSKKNKTTKNKNKSNQDGEIYETQKTVQTKNCIKRKINPAAGAPLLFLSLKLIICSVISLPVYGLK